MAPGFLRFVAGVLWRVGVLGLIWGAIEGLADGVAGGFYASGVVCLVCVMSARYLRYVSRLEVRPWMCGNEFTAWRIGRLRMEADEEMGG